MTEKVIICLIVCVTLFLIALVFMFFSYLSDRDFCVERKRFEFLSGDVKDLQARLEKLEKKVR